MTPHRSASVALLKPTHTYHLYWSLPAHRRGTLSGMDAAPEPTWTYLRRVRRWWVGKGPAANSQRRVRGALTVCGTRREPVPGGSVAASMPPHGPATGKDTAPDNWSALCLKSCLSRGAHQTWTRCFTIEQGASGAALNYAYRPSRLVLARSPSRDPERHGCRAGAYMDVLAACHAMVGGQGPCSQATGPPLWRMASHSARPQTDSQLPTPHSPFPSCTPAHAMADRIAA
ncbi:hypothetical protein FHT15_001404 [Xanthomonas campestris]